MMNVNLNPSAIAKLSDDPGVIVQLGDRAEAINDRARRFAPSWLTPKWIVRAGVGPKGGFAQAIARGSGTVLAEYGGSRSRAYGYMRRASR